MGLTKTLGYTSEQQLLAQFAKALAHPARIAILQTLLEKRTCVCGELVSDIGLAHATISQHLKELKLVGLIQGSISGARVCYCINPKTMSKVKEAFAQLLNESEISDLNCC